MQFLYPFFSLNGRLTSRQYSFKVLTYPIIMALPILMLMIIWDKTQNPISVYLMIPLLIAPIFCAVALTIRRLHDRGKSGWWFALYFIGGFSIILTSGHDFVAPFRDYYLLLGMGIYLSGVLDVFLPGNKYENEYGPVSKVWPSPKV